MIWERSETYFNSELICRMYLLTTVLQQACIRLRQGHDFTALVKELSALMNCLRDEFPNHQATLGV